MAIRLTRVQAMELELGPVWWLERGLLVFLA